MLERRYRLTSSAGFSAATRRGRRAGTRTVVLHLATPQVGPDSRDASGTVDPREPLIGFVVSKAVGNAVVRNRVRRRLRHLCREQVGSLPEAAVLVVRALPASAAASSATLDRDLRSALGRLGAGLVSDTPAVLQVPR